MTKQAKQIKKRLEYLRKELRAERISYGELAELQGMAKHIDPADIELLEAAGVPKRRSGSMATGGEAESELDNLLDNISLEKVVSEQAKAKEKGHNLAIYTNDETDEDFSDAPYEISVENVGNDFYENKEQRDKVYNLLLEYMKPHRMATGGEGDVKKRTARAMRLWNKELKG